VRLLLPLLLLAGCATEFVDVDRQPGLEGRWNEGATSLDVSGSTATLTFLGRLFVFENVTWLRGQMAEKDLYLTGERLHIHADETEISIVDGKVASTRPLAELPAGSRFAWHDGMLQPR
jgi:hypothetical protein